MIKKLIILSDEPDDAGLKNGFVLKSGTDLKNVDRDLVSRDYIEFVSGLNFKFGSIDWWAGSIGSKNQYVSQLYKNICYYLEITAQLKNSETDEFYVVLYDEFLIKQLDYYCRKNGIVMELRGRHRRNTIKDILIFIKDNLSFLYFNLKTRGTVEKQLKPDIKQKLNKKKDNYVLRTWVDKRSFDDNNKYRDIFYGDLVEHIKKVNDVFSICVFLSSFEENLAKVKFNNSHYPVPVIPIFYFQKPFDYFKVVLRQLGSALKVKGQVSTSEEMKFQDHDITNLVLREIFENLITGEYRRNLLHYYTAKNVARDVNCKGFLIPYENHSWEILSILAFQKWSPDTTFIGYQHASISRRLFNYYLGAKDRNAIPLPSKIITVGPAAKRILKDMGNFPEEKLTAGPAFRFQGLYEKRFQPRKSNNKILVAFSIGLDDSINFLKFMLKTLGENKNYSVLIKCHPSMPMEKILSAGKLKLPKSFRVIEDRSISELLDEVDMMIYSDTTASMEALMMGIPVIYLDIDSLYEKDALFECNNLKWSVKSPKELKSAINDIYNMTDREYKKQQKLARKYMENYFSRVSEEKMEEFLRTD